MTGCGNSLACGGAPGDDQVAMIPGKTLIRGWRPCRACPESVEKIVHNVDPAKLANSPGNEFALRVK